MFLLKPILQKIDEKETIRYSGGKKDAAIDKSLLKDVLNQALIYASPSSVWQIYDYKNGVVQAVDENYAITSEKLSFHLNACTKVVIMAVTVGSRIEDRVGELFASSDYAKAVLLDAAATAAVEQAADAVCSFIAAEQAKLGFSIGARFSPGYGDWDIKEQPAIIKLSCAQHIGVSANKSLMLIPQKSVTAIVGLKPCQNEPKTKKTACDSCSQVGCQYKKGEIEC